MLALGQVVITARIKEVTDHDMVFLREVLTIFDRYKANDWGDMSEDDNAMNDEAVESGERVFAAYNTTQGKVYIITEYDRSVTTVLFAEEY